MDAISKKRGKYSWDNLHFHEEQMNLLKLKAITCTRSSTKIESKSLWCTIDRYNQIKHMYAKLGKTSPRVSHRNTTKGEKTTNL